MAMRRAQCGFLFSACIMHSVLGGSGGMLPQENLARPYESASEAVGDHHNHTKFMAIGL